MSWDVFFMRMPPGVRTLAEVPRDFVGEPLGARAEVIATLRARLPGVDFSDPAWGRLVGPDFSIELNLGHEPVAASLMLHVRGGDGALGVVREVSEALGCPALDTTEGELIDFDSPRAAAGFRKWRAFRDEVTRAR